MKATAPLPPGPLQGVRVLDLSRVLAGPFCTQFLADLGAEVLKIERPGTGDDTRQWGPPWAGGESAYFLSCNRSKKSITLDLSRVEGRKLLRRLIACSDILIENFKVGTMAKWGLGYEALKSERPSLIFCSISAYGQDSSERHEPGYDFIIQARGGIMSVTGPADGLPHKVGVAVADITAGLYAAASILAALHRRHVTGSGEFIDISLFDSQVSWLANVGMNYLVSGQLPGRFGNAHPNIVPYEVFSTASGHIAIAVGNDAQFEKLCGALACPELAADDRFRTNAGRVQHRTALTASLNERLAGRATAHWLVALKSAGVPCARINTIDQVFREHVIHERRMLQHVAHPTAGNLALIGAVPKFAESGTAEPSAPPLLGEHTESVLANLLQLSAEDIAGLRRQHII